MRRAAKVDANQREIVKALRLAGATVQSLASSGDGVPDLLVGFQHKTVLMELKDGSKTPSKRKLTKDQIDWHGDWRGGPLYIVESVGDALAAIGIHIPKNETRCVNSGPLTNVINKGNDYG